MILSKTPVRIACGGGGTDVEPYSSDFNGYVINVTINNYFRSILNERNDKLIRIFSNDKFSAYKFEKIEKLK
ncbi:MAG: GHMP kinase, partial [Promethearchaeota archaeon]